MAKDSLHMNEQDRRFIISEIKDKQTGGNAVVVTHGTDTMTETAIMAFENLKNLVAPVIFTGAMRPLGFEHTDAWQNLTEALLAAKIAPPGVYISFHNHLFNLPNVRKNKERRTFEQI